jgi:hypothetical protein
MEKTFKSYTIQLRIFLLKVSSISSFKSHFDLNFLKAIEEK